MILTNPLPKDLLTMKLEMTPRSMSFHFPAEFERQTAMWLSWPHKEASWPGKIESIYNPYCEFILQVADHQNVNINVDGSEMEKFALDKISNCLYANKISNLSEILNNIKFYHQNKYRYLTK